MAARSLGGRFVHSIKRDLLLAVTHVVGGTARRVSVSSRLTLDGDDELRDDGQDLVGPSAEHVVHALLREKRVGHLQLAEPVEEDWQVVVEIQLQKRRFSFTREDQRTRNNALGVMI